MDQTEKSTTLEFSLNKIKEAFNVLSSEPKTRELSLVITKLEEAMMWLNKHRTIIGQLPASDTHVQK